MTAEVFLDTNILVYAAIGTGRDEPKRLRALELIQTEEFGTSAQVLQEFFSNPRKAATALMTAPSSCRGGISSCGRFPIGPMFQVQTKRRIENLPYIAKERDSDLY